MLTRQERFAYYLEVEFDLDAYEDFLHDLDHEEFMTEVNEFDEYLQHQLAMNRDGHTYATQLF